MKHSKPIDLIVVHCTDSPDTLDIGRSVIDQWHKARGWAGVGYHYVVRRDGTIELGRPEDEVGAHVEGHNDGSLGVVWVGRKEPAKPQRAALLGVVKMLLKKHRGAAVVGHCELNAGKTCPNLSMPEFRAEVNA